MNEMDAAGAEALRTAPKQGEVARRIPPWLFALLIAPSAVLANGVVQGGVLAYLMRQQGVGIGRIGVIVSLVSWPTSLYFLWSPITDFLVQRRTWLLIGAVGAGALMGIAFRQPNLAVRGAVALIFLAVCCSQLVVSSCGGMMGTLPKGRPRVLASSFYQAGSAGFGALAAFVLILVADRHSLLTGLVVLLIAAPGLISLTVARQPTQEDGEDFGSVVRRLGLEFKATFWRWSALPYALVLVFPMNSGAAIGLLPGVARDYGVSGAQVAWMNGLAGALLVAAGSLAGTLIPARVRASVAYLIVGLVNAATLLILWLGPARPGVYFAGTTLYLFTAGTGLATFTAVVLEFLGDSGRSGSGRYSIINSLGNVPVLYMLVLDGWGGQRWGARGLPATEAVFGGVGAAILLAYFLLRGGALAASTEPAVGP
jgi:PAT family beta-lactamase induction signal transducer AmpG